MPVEKPEIFSGFLRFSPFSSLFQNSILSKNKKMPNADLDLVRGIGLVECYFRAGFSFKTFWKFWSESFSLEEFTPLKPPFFRFSQKALLNFCVWERRCFGSSAYIKKKTATPLLPVLFQRKMQTAVVLLLSGQSTHGVPLYLKHENNNKTQKETTWST